MIKNIKFKFEIDGKECLGFEKKGRKINLIFESEVISVYESKKRNISVYCLECNSVTKIKTVLPIIKLDKPYLCRSCRNLGERNGMYGKKFSDETKKLFSLQRRGEKNYFFGKKHTNETKNKISEKNKNKYDGDKNPMYGKSFFDVWVQKYGIEKALSLLENKKNKHKFNSSNEKNPMFKVKLFDLWVEKYGIIEAERKYLEWKKNISKSLYVVYENNDELKNKISNSLKNRIFTDEHRKNLRISSIKYLELKQSLIGNKMCPHFNIKACKLFDLISEIKNTNIQHALNGGEYYIPELGYWVDGYDKKNNIVYEYYERGHNNKIERDEKRKNEIIDLLKCEFIIIHEKNDEEYLKQLIDETNRNK